MSAKLYFLVIFDVSYPRNETKSDLHSALFGRIRRLNIKVWCNKQSIYPCISVCFWPLNVLLVFQLHFAE